MQLDAEHCQRRRQAAAAKQHLKGLNRSVPPHLRSLPAMPRHRMSRAGALPAPGEFLRRSGNLGAGPPTGTDGAAPVRAARSRGLILGDPKVPSLLRDFQPTLRDSNPGPADPGNSGDSALSLHHLARLWGPRVAGLVPEFPVQGAGVGLAEPRARPGRGALQRWHREVGHLLPGGHLSAADGQTERPFFRGR
ncbi:uncharacterized protein [Aphelocoma coerulescens]|uniref:uncharacterized protein isoform X1 n=1 Tax=Aphelocoma coerulescens TaxID=39617 RepID=UPI0036053F36